MPKLFTSPRPSFAELLRDFHSQVRYDELSLNEFKCGDAGAWKGGQAVVN